MDAKARVLHGQYSSEGASTLVLRVYTRSESVSSVQKRKVQGERRGGGGEIQTRMRGCCTRPEPLQQAGKIGYIANRQGTNAVT